MKNKNLSKKQVRKLWVAALRSGKYTQGTGYLRSRSDKYCCLGVLCDLAIKHKITDQDWNLGYIGDQSRSYYIGIKSCLIPPVVMKWAGLKTSAGEFSGNDSVNSLASANDSGNYTFEDIANLIETEPEGLFV